MMLLLVALAHGLLPRSDALSCLIWKTSGLKLSLFPVRIITSLLSTSFCCMANSNNQSEREPSNAPQPEKWYTLRLGSSFKDNPRTKFCTLRYEFKPASIDKSQAGSFHKNKENKVTVEFQNNQPGKSKVSFEGSCEDYKENDAVLFFDGETFRLERLHRAVKRLRHVRLPGEPMALASQAPVAPAGLSTDPRSSPFGKAIKSQAFNNSSIPAIAVEVERIDIGNGSPVAKPASGTVADLHLASPNLFPDSPNSRSGIREANIDIMADDSGDDLSRPGTAADVLDAGVDINISNLGDTDDEIADVDVSDGDDKGPNAAEALRAQVNAEGNELTSSSSDSSGSASSGSGSGSPSSSGSEGSEDDSVSSGGEVDV